MNDFALKVVLHIFKGYRGWGVIMVMKRNPPTVSKNY